MTFLPCIRCIHPPLHAPARQLSARPGPGLTWQVRPPGELHEAVELAAAPTPAGPAPAAAAAATRGSASASPPAVPVPALGGRHDPRKDCRSPGSGPPQARPHLGTAEPPSRAPRDPGDRGGQGKGGGSRAQLGPMAERLGDRQPMSRRILGRWREAGRDVVTIAMAPKKKKKTHGGRWSKEEADARRAHPTARRPGWKEPGGLIEGRVGELPIPGLQESQRP